ncbi:ADL187Wp [Eremothecium gossypii ATCC 10895]|uniref:ADL187Wp n=1 Tax=Eremothecium gossypii (strain ATCC 10895 / CBS 109.51 / FGSC 9923 / NRRL Y-1056) TaxID=284811 RepID=Q75AV7_EREGS|nr:ADL187Wp [Eremothecium gossypii ATCC 10895]AAS51733.1 ADL187Wp [Eremothecium gossypii ATCC 10895]AEY96030.1 FADL187Wp [Eremothecium gossypii FDAG1]
MVIQQMFKMVVGGTAVVITACLGALYVYQSKLVYPSWAQGARKHVDTPDLYGLPYQELRLRTRDGVEIRAFDIRNLRSKGTILVLAPNGGNIGYFLSVAELLYRQMGLSVFLYSYRGYGYSEGEPSEQGLKLDADRVMEYMRKDEFYRTQRLVLYGRSLGGANALYIARKYGAQCDALILENTFLSIPKVIPYVFPYLRYVSFLCREVWNSEEEIRLVDETIPILFLSGLKDEIVPPSHMQALYSLSKSSGKKFVTFADGYHNDTIIQNGYWDVVHDFLQKHDVI